MNKVFVPLKALTAMKISNIFAFKVISSYLLIAALLFTFHNTVAQETKDRSSSPLNEQFQELKSNSESYNEYKVIKTYKLNEFWSTVEDTLNLLKKDINEANSKIAELEAKVNDLTNELTETKADLEIAVNEKNSLSIFGLNIQKNLYNIVMWGIIIGLLVLSGFSFIAFKESNRVTRRTRKDHDDLHKEFEDYRRKAQEKKVKIMRELQTERNKVDELKQKQKLNKEHSDS